MKYSEILKKNKLLTPTKGENVYNIKVLSNIMTFQINDILEYTLRKENIPARLKTGNYDNILQDSQLEQNEDVVIIFWEICNLYEGIYFNIELSDGEKIREIYKKTKNEIDFVLKNLKNIPLVLFNTFTASAFSLSKFNLSNLEILASDLNKYIKLSATTNLKIINLDEIFKINGILNNIDFRSFYSSKVLYNINFYKEYSKYIKPLIMSMSGNTKKAIIFDCDNTLWGGVIGEDGFDNIEMSPNSQKGVIFSEIQSLALALSKKGIIIGLCSKNNYLDVENVFLSHPNIVLLKKYITIEKINWLDKVTNLKNIASELNIGLDSIVFVDDASFEINLVNEQLPEVRTIQVPKKLYLYPRMLRNSIDLFFSISETEEDKKKLKMYKNQKKRLSTKKKYTSIKDYLKSLHIQITIYSNNISLIPRISQMTQKTNQFNLTTKRYSENDIENFFNNENYRIFSMSVSDKFGDSGVTGLCILRIKRMESIAIIDTFLLSCRIIGRDIEYAFLDFILNSVKKLNIKIIKANYFKTQKNNQVNEFFDKCNFTLKNNNEEIKKYEIRTNSYIRKNIKYIKVKNG